MDLLGLGYLVVLAPLASFVLLLVFGPALGRRAHFVGITATLFSAGAAALLLFRFLQEGPVVGPRLTWLTLGDLVVDVRFEVSALSAIMLFTVSLVSFLVHVYSAGYMAGDPRYHVFYTYLSLFTFGMLALVFSANMLARYLFWEIVGLASFLLIGFWFEKPAAREAAKKAFLVTRVGDVGFFAALLFIFTYVKSFDDADLFAAVSGGAIPDWALTAIALLLFLGAAGKSGQFPLHVWLPDAMEGPTPVSALIHAATMVAAGVYLVAAAYPVFLAAPYALDVVAWVGAFTALFAGTMGLAEYDIKRVLAYSTISQLGYMMLALGVGAYVAALFHLTAHAYFKALLFLAAGSIIHATGTQDIREMGGLLRHLPRTSLAFLAGAFALVGIPPFAGFFSKEFILERTLEANPALYAMGLAAAFVTALYVGRLIGYVFFGENRSSRGVHESPPVMLIPLYVLTAFALGYGFLETPWAPLLSRFFASDGTISEIHPPVFGPDALLGVGVGLLGLFVGVYAVLQGKRVAPWGRFARPVFQVLARRYYIDDFYHVVFVRGAIALGHAAQAVQTFVVEGTVALVVLGTEALARLGSAVQNGRVQTYGAVATLGIALLLLLALWKGGLW
ncbi:MAG: NADH-ubiquinone oxidoreductase chain L [Brockia lithotrophica]|uniref:NADH-ubiquinone oxidoreductase chain L n=1 Tax=Brockia lithotrophica TaxID=933949 RepID=A0A2T5GAW6_9BACL|nr:MAG: NADH-ubiquinone oxidoreductase chain L [Brockia lithotrophica]